MTRSTVRGLSVLGALLLTGGLAAWAWQSKPSTAQTPPPPALPQVTVAHPQVQRITDTREFAGRFEPNAAIAIRARVTGHLDKIGFEDGQIVKAGQTLFVLDPRPYRAAVDEAKAQLAAAQAQTDLAVLELDRAQQLVGTSAVSRATLDQRKQQKLAADAATALAEATLTRAMLDLEYTEIRAPISGRVSNRRLDVGSLVSDPGTLLTTIVALDPIYFVFDMSERDFVAHSRAMKDSEMRSLRDGTMPVDLRLAEDTTWPFKGTLSFVDNRLEQGTGTIRARATLPNADLFITPGQFGRVRLPASADYDAVLIPETALLTDQADRIALKLGPDNVLQRATLQLGPTRPGGLRVVRSGLGPDDRIVVDGLLRARPGEKVAPVQRDAPPATSARANTGAPKTLAN